LRTVNTKYNFWLSGYYDDFSSARSIADDLNAASALTLDHTKTHFGSALGKGLSTLNPRFAFDYPDRVRTSIIDGEAAFGYSTFTSTTDDKLKHNGGIADWLTIDPTKSSSGDYEARASLQHPNSVIGNRQKWGNTTYPLSYTNAGESWLAFTNGHDTAGTYYCPLGLMNWSFDNAPLAKANLQDGGNNHKAAGSPITFLTDGQSDSNDTTWDMAEHSMMNISFASVYYGEQQIANESPSGITGAQKYTSPLVSPSKMPFFIHNAYIEHGNGNFGSPSTTSGTQRIMTYTGNLRFKGVGEAFHLRLSAHAITNGTFSYSLKIGYKGDTEYNTASDNFDDTTSLMTVTITSANLGISQGGLDKYEKAVGQSTPAYDWVDIIVIPDFDANTWRAYKDNATTHFANGSINTGVTVNTAKGWSLDLGWAHDSAKDYVSHTTLIDRAAVALPLSHADANLDITQFPPVNSFDISYGSNEVSSAKITLLDDSNYHLLAPLTTGTAASEWRMLMFYEGEDRPIWSGIIESISHKQSHSRQTLETTISARDSLSVLDRTLPIWELGQNAIFSLNDHISFSNTMTKRINETQALSDKLFMGSVALSNYTSTLGFNKYDTDSRSTGHGNVGDKRTNLYSSSAIQMYINEDEDGPNFAEREWEGYNAGSVAVGGDTVELLRVIGHHPSHNGGPSSTERRCFYVEYEDEATPTLNASTTYHGFTAGDNFRVDGGSFNTSTTYVIEAVYIYERREEPGKYIVEFRTTDTSGGVGNNQQIATHTVTAISAVSSIETNIVSAYHYTFSINANGVAHGLTYGDQISFPAGITDGTATHRILASVPLTVIGVPANDTVIVRSPALTSSSETINLSSYRTAFDHPYDLTVINSHDHARYPNVKPILIGTAVQSNTFYDQIKYRNAHARWMRDLSLSPWFKAQFGIIANSPYWRAGKGSHTQHPFDSTVAATISQWPNADGTTNWTGLNADIAIGDTTIVFEEPAMWYYQTSLAKDYAIIDLIDNVTNEHQFVVGTTFSTPANSSTITWDSSNEYFNSTMPNGTFSVGQIVVHRGFEDERANGVHMIYHVNTTSDYKTFKITDYKGTRDGFSFLQARYQSGAGWNDGTSRHNQDPDAVEMEIYHVSQDPMAAINGDSATVFWGATTLSGVKGIKRDWDKDSTIYSLRKVDESNGYKHCFVLWADMRNDGTADADGGTRKSNFGLQLPTSANYSIELTFADQMDENGNPDVFTELKIGEDVDLWNLDGLIEPFTRGTWAAQNGASNSEPATLSHYRNWETKAGAICLVDASRFWNLNTAACGGRPGYDAGGLAGFSDYETASFGFPYLIDHYWGQAVTSYKNVTSSGSEGLAKHKNSIYFINDGTTLKSPIVAGETRLYVKDTSQFDSTGYGVIICETGSGRNAEKTVYYYYWNGKGVGTIQGQQVPYLNNVYITSYEIVTSPKNAVTQLKADSGSYSSGSAVDIATNEFVPAGGTKTEGAFSKVRIYNTTAALYGFRLALNVIGRVKSANMGTFHAHEKIKFLQNLGIADSWAKNASLPCISDINNVPLTNNLASGEGFGCALDTRGQTFMSILTEMADKEGIGSVSATPDKSFAFLMGRDNRLDFREAYSNNIALTRNELKVSQLDTQNGSKITNVRVYYNGNSAFADYPTPQGSDLRWQVLNYPKIFNKDEAEALAKQEYLRQVTARISVSAEVIRGTTENNIMMSGRHGYLADTCIKMLEDDATAQAFWTNRRGGSPFNGMQNALHLSQPSSDANNSYFVIPANQTWQALTHVIPRLVKASDGSAPTAASQIAFYPAGGTYTQAAIRFSYDGATNYGTQTTFTTAGYYTATSVVSGVTYTLSFYVGDVSGVTGGGGFETLDCTFAECYIKNNHKDYMNFYGTNSLSHAVQVVHVDANTNLVSETSGEELRVAIAIDNAASSPDHDAAQFRVYLLDYSFSSTTSGSGGSFQTPTFGATHRGNASVLVTANGLYEVTLPSSYDSNSKKVLLSINCDYLRALVKHRCNDTGLNKNHISGVTLASISASANTMFPLGQRDFEEYGHYRDYDSRLPYYSPRIHIVEDLKFIPATTLTYTDTHVDLSSESMVVKGVSWSQKDRQHEKVTIKMEKANNHYAYNFASMISRGLQPKEPPQPSSPPPPKPKPTKPTIPSLGGGTTQAPLLNVGTNMQDGDPASMFGGLNANDISAGFARMVKGKADFASDSATSDANWGVVGSKNTGVASSFDRAVDGLDTMMASSEGSAIATSDGFVLNGISDAEAGASNELHSHSMNVRVPNDTSTGFISVVGSVSMDSITGGGNAEITTTIECIETGASHTTSKIVSQGSSRASIVLMPSSIINGAEVAGNTLKMTISRKPAQGNDAAPYQSIKIHNVSVNIRRFNKPTTGQSNAFKPY
jgi:hypothetical protein